MLMTLGEKLIWASVYGRVYLEHVRGFKVDMNTAKSIGEQREDWRHSGVVLAAEEATDVIETAREAPKDMLSESTSAMLDAMQT